jgi:hypothetical protein
LNTLLKKEMTYSFPSCAGKELVRRQERKRDTIETEAGDTSERERAHLCRKGTGEKCKLISNFTTTVEKL